MVEFFITIPRVLLYNIITEIFPVTWQQHSRLWLILQQTLGITYQGRRLVF